MNGSIQIIVNLRSRSVEYDREPDAVNRNSCVLRTDTVLASDFEQVPSVRPNETDDEKVIRCVKSMHEMARNVGNLSYFMVKRGGHKLYLHPDDISFVTIEAYGDLAEIEE